MNDKTNSNDAGFDAKLDQLRQAFADELVKRLGAPSAPNTESSVRGSWARLRAAADDIKN